MKDSIREVTLRSFERQKTFQFKVDYRLLLAFFSLLFGPFGLGASSNKWQLLFILITVLLVFVFLLLRRESIVTCLQYSLVIKVKDVFSITILTCLFYLLGLSIRSPKLTEDELYYSYNGFNQISFVLNRVLENVGALDRLPYAYLLITTVIIVISLLKYLKSYLNSLNDTKFITTLYSLVVVFQIAYALFGIDAIHNPPGYSLWYLPISTLFGITHESFRFATNILFAMVGWWVFSNIRKSTDSYLVAYLSLATFISTPLILQMSGMVEISNFAFIANLVVISRLVSNNLIVSPWMMYFASVMFYFRLTNLALLVSLIVLGITQNQKAHRVHISNTLVIAMPGVSSIILARFSFTNTEDTDFFPSLMDRLRDFIELLQDSNSYPYLFCFVWFVVFLAVKFVRGYIFAFTFTLLYLILMLIMTGQMISHSKYLIEFIYSMTPLVGFMYKGNLTRSSYFSIIRNISVVLSLFAINYYGLISKSELVERTAIEATDRPNEAFSNSYLPQDPFPYKEAYEVLENKRESVCLSVGIVYGLVYEVWERFSVGELKVLRRQYGKLLMLQNEKNESPFSISADTILDSDITCFILGNVANKESTIKILRDSGWSVLSKLVDERFGSTVYVVVQDPVGANRINS